MQNTYNLHYFIIYTTSILIKPSDTLRWYFSRVLIFGYFSEVGVPAETSRPPFLCKIDYMYSRTSIIRPSIIRNLDYPAGKFSKKKFKKIKKIL